MWLSCLSECTLMKRTFIQYGVRCVWRTISDVIFLCVTCVSVCVHFMSTLSNWRKQTIFNDFNEYFVFFTLRINKRKYYLIFICCNIGIYISLRLVKLNLYSISNSPMIIICKINKFLRITFWLHFGKYSTYFSTSLHKLVWKQNNTTKQKTTTIKKITTQKIGCSIDISKFWVARRTSSKNVRAFKGKQNCVRNNCSKIEIKIIILGLGVLFQYILWKCVEWTTQFFSRPKSSTDAKSKNLTKFLRSIQHLRTNF